MHPLTVANGAGASLSINGDIMPNKQILCQKPGGEFQPVTNIWFRGWCLNGGVYTARMQDMEEGKTVKEGPYLFKLAP